MSNYPVQDVQRQPLRAANSALSRSHSRSSSQTFTTPQHTPTPFLTDLAAGISQTFSSFEPPAKRQRLDNNRSASEKNGSVSASLTEQIKQESKAGGNDASSESLEHRKLSPFPRRPKAQSRGKGAGTVKPVQPPKREEVSTKPYTTDPPKFAPRLAGGSAVDFSPWLGGQTEDKLSEQTIRQGHYDKSQVSQNETGSARSIILASVKHKNGLQILSNLYISALKQRQAAGLVTAKSTFKLPPRVTLTDTKREAWLRDLSDSAIPLRRLSRSIPHGVRGKILLDQCLTKNIPPWRAVWLAKCVGANEIRAFKRKGTSGAFVSGGETKWVKDWTSSLHQFLESLVDAYGTPEWETSMIYGMQLISHIYADHLLDLDLFLDSIIAAIHNATAKTLPLWLWIHDSFLKDITSRRRRGRTLAVALADQITRTRGNEAGNVGEQLFKKLSPRVRSLILSHPDCFVLSERWEKYEKALQDCGSDEAFKHIFASIKLRNERIGLLRGPQSMSARSGRPNLMAALDNVDSTFDFAQLSKNCRLTTDEDKTLVYTVLEWATTRFRFGKYRLYLAARLLRAWARQGVDLDLHAITFLSDSTAIVRVDYGLLCKLVAELVRSRHLSIGRYIQRLMARGLSALSQDSPFGRFQLQLLNTVPLHGLPEHTLNIRNIILQNFEAQRNSLYSVEIGKAYCKTMIPCLVAQDGSETSVSSDFELSSLSGSTKLDIAHWIRQAVAAYVSDSSSDDELSMDGEDAKAPMLSSQDFSSICSIIIELEDYAILADMHSITLECCGTDLLTDLAYSLNRHYDVFNAMGATLDLFRKLLERTGDVRGRSSTERPLFMALIELAKRPGNLIKTAQKLQMDLASCEPTSALAACSPVSDQMAEALQNADSTFLEEVEMLLNSGTSMDQVTLKRVFGDIMKRIESSWVKDRPMMLSLFEILAKLREFNEGACDKLMLDWLTGVIIAKDRPPLARIIVPLVNNGVVRLRDMLSRALQVLVPSSNKESVLAEVVELILFGPDDAMLEECLFSYRFEDSKKDLLRNSSSEVKSLVVAAIKCSVAKTHRGIRKLVTDEKFSSFLLTIFKDMQNDAGTSVGELSKLVAASKAMLQSIDKALSLSPSEETALDSMRKLFAAANDFNVSLCQLRISTITEHKTSKLSDKTANKGLAESLVDFLLPSFTDRPDAWRQLLCELGPDISAKALSYATSMLLQRLNEGDSTATDPAAELNDLLLLAQTLLSPAAGEPNDDFGPLDLIASSLTAFRTRLSTLPLSASATTVMLDAEVRASRLRNICSGLSVLLDLTSAHQRLFASPKAPAASLTRLAVALAGVLAENNLSMQPEVATHVFDVLALLSDSMPAEARQHAAHQLDSGPRDPRLDFLLGLSDLDEERRWALVMPLADQAQCGGGGGGGGGGGDASKAAVRSTSSFGSGFGSAFAFDPFDSADATDAPKTRSVPFPLRHWEMVPDATPVVGENDASLSLTLFGAARAIL